MNKPDINKLEDIAPHVMEHLVPEIKQAVEACIKAHNSDPFNDTWTFGTQLWRNVWNRFESVARFEDCPFGVCGKGNEYKLKIGNFVLRHHRIDEESKLPNGAKAVKAAAQMFLFGAEWDAPVEIDNIILAIDADVQRGLKEVFIGELKQMHQNLKKYNWGMKIPIYLADGAQASTAESINIYNTPGLKQHAPEEEVPEVAIALDKTITAKKIGKRDSGK